MTLEKVLWQSNIEIGWNKIKIYWHIEAVISTLSPNIDTV